MVVEWGGGGGGGRRIFRCSDFLSKLDIVGSCFREMHIYSLEGFHFKLWYFGDRYP